MEENLDKKGGIDGKDIAILEALQRDGRMSVSDLGKAIGLSQPATSERLKRLEESGIIAGYSARVDARALGLGMTAIVRLRTSHEHIQNCLKRFATIPNVVEVHRVTGDYCFVLKVLVSRPEDLERVVDQIAGFGAVSTAVVLRTEPTKPIDKQLLRDTDQ